MGTTYRNFTIQECDATLAQYKEHIDAGRIAFWQKFTCEKCWKRITVDTPNKLFVLGHCQECGHVSDLRKSGCNYLVRASRRPIRESTT